MRLINRRRGNVKRQALMVFSVAMLFSSSAFAQQYCKVGSERWVEGCAASCTASWNGGDCPRACTATAPVGFVIIDHRVQAISVSNGGHDVSRVAAGQTFDYKRRVQQAYSDTLDVAGKANNKSAQGRIKEDMRSALAEAESFNSSHQAVHLKVSASRHGNRLNQKRGWSNHKVEILVKCVVPANLESQLMKKYALQ